MTKKLYVGNLAPAVNAETLKALFSAHGTVENVNIITDRQTGTSKGYGFVEFSSEDQAQAAVEALNGTEQSGQAIKVAVANPPTDKRTARKSFGSGPRRGGSGGGGGGFGRSDNRQRFNR